MIKEKVVRSQLLAAVHEFVRAASRLSGVHRIALIGSLTTTKTNPKDADVLVTVTDEMDLTALAKLGRRLKGTAQQINLGADIFARNCGLRSVLHDDLDTVCLDSHLIAAPPLDLWPQVIERSHLPSDVRETLLRVNHKGSLGSLR